jgi:hypothetical protein
MLKKVFIFGFFILLICVLTYRHLNPNTSTSKAASYNISDQEIRSKFDCNRITLELRDTDIFCSNPNFYRYPDVSKAQYYSVSGCEDILNHPEYKAEYPDSYKQCSDKTTYNQAYIKFKAHLYKIRR